MMYIASARQGAIAMLENKNSRNPKKRKEKGLFLFSVRAKRAEVNQDGKDGRWNPIDEGSIGIYKKA